VKTVVQFFSLQLREPQIMT